jgi:hypothetical protein
MCSIVINDDHLTVQPAALDRVAGLLRMQTIDRSAITAVEVVDDGLIAAMGLRPPGLAVPGRRTDGTWRGRGVTSSVDLRRGQPALRIRVCDPRCGELLIASDTAASIADHLAPLP